MLKGPVTASTTAQRINESMYPPTPPPWTWTPPNRYKTSWPVLTCMHELLLCSNAHTYCAWFDWEGYVQSLGGHVARSHHCQPSCKSRAAIDPETRYLGGGVLTVFTTRATACRRFPMWDTSGWGGRWSNSGFQVAEDKHVQSSVILR